jgi:glyoxylate/hydroxypyruvate reductase
MAVLYRADVVRGRRWARFFAEHAPDIPFRIWPEAGDLSEIEYLVAWQAPASLLTELPNLKVLFSSGAGVDHVDLAAIPPHVQFVRMVEPGIINGMVEYVTMSALALHRDLFDYMHAQAEAAWRPAEIRPASARTIGVMGLGVLGQAVLDRLGTFGFRRCGWNRSPREIPGVTCYAGPASLETFLAQCEILICLLPLTDATHHILDAHVFAALPRGASIVNVGRGGHVDQKALLDAIDNGYLARAVLDVADPEPLPASHAFWRHPRIVLTPHIASATQPETAAPVLLDNLRRHQRGEALQGVVDRRRGY